MVFCKNIVPEKCKGCLSLQIYNNKNKRKKEWKCRSFLSIPKYQQDLAENCPCQNCIIKGMCTSQCEDFFYAKRKILNKYGEAEEMCSEPFALIQRRKKAQM